MSRTWISKASRLFLLIVAAVLLGLTIVQPAAALTAEDRLRLYRPFYDANSQEACSENGPITLTGSENAEKIYFFFISQGFQPFQAAGIMGNMQAEAGFEPRLVEYGWPNSRGETSRVGQPSSLDDNVPPNVGPQGQPGYGIIQWTDPGRKQGLRDLVAANGVQGSDLATQLQYIMKELNGSYRASTYTPLLASTTIEDATNIVMRNYERPGDMAKQGPLRLSFARNILARFESATPGSPSETSDVSNSGCGGTTALSGCPDGPAPLSEMVTVQGITVHPCISQEVDKMVSLAKSQGLTLTGGGYRDAQGQINARRQNCGTSQYDIYEKPSGQCSPPTARPGTSRHESGAAVDFSCNGRLISTRSNPCYLLLEQNSTLKNLPSEAWHFSDNGR